MTGMTGMTVDEVALARAPAADWDRAEREARHAAVLVATFVGVPAAVAAAAALLIFALTWLVLLAPLVAAVLTWMAWRYGRPEPRAGTGGARLDPALGPGAPGSKPARP